ncbi:MAG: ABC transporter permease [Thalassobaculales bacterium]
MTRGRSASPFPFWRPLSVAGGLLLAWQGLVWLTGVPPFLLPGPGRVAATLLAEAGLLAGHAAITLAEILAGLALGGALGAGVALAITAAPGLSRWLLPLMVGSQAVPVFALAPLLVLWLGYGMPSKVAMAALIIFFPVATGFLDGLSRAEGALTEAARTLGCRGWRLLWRVRVPAALPGLASGLKVGAAVAPIGAVIGEWVGASAGLGFLMMQANARMQIDLMFAALLVLAAMGVALFRAVEAVLARLLHWT